MSMKTIKVRMKGLGCSPEGHYREGYVYDVPEELGNQLVAAFQAELAGDDERASRPDGAADAGCEPEAEVAAVRAKGKRG